MVIFQLLLVEEVLKVPLQMLITTGIMPGNAMSGKGHLLKVCNIQKKVKPYSQNCHNMTMKNYTKQRQASYCNKHIS